NSKTNSLSFFAIIKGIKYEFTFDKEEITMVNTSTKEVFKTDYDNNKINSFIIETALISKDNYIFKKNNNGFNIANTILRNTNYSLIGNFQSTSSRIKDFKVEKDFVKALCESGRDIDLLKHIILQNKQSKKFNTNDLVDILASACFSGNPEIVRLLEQQSGIDIKILDYNEKINILKQACAGDRIDIVDYILNYFQKDYNFFSLDNKDQIVDLFEVIKNPEIASHILYKIDEEKINTISNIIAKDDYTKKVLEEYSDELLAIYNCKKNPELLIKNINSILKEIKRNKLYSSIYEEIYNITNKIQKTDKETVENISNEIMSNLDYILKNTNNTEKKSIINDIFNKNITNYDKKNSPSIKRKIREIANDLDSTLPKKDDILNEINSLPNFELSDIFSTSIDFNHFEITLFLLKEIEKKKYEIDLNSYFNEAIEKKDIKIVKLLFPQINDEKNILKDNNPLYLAVKDKNTEMVESLLSQQKNININAIDINMKTLLHLAIEKNNMEMVQLLLSQPGIDINAEDSRGYTPLHLAIEKNNREMVQLLLSQPGIDINAEDSRGYTPLHLAVDEKNMEIAQLLLSQQELYININAKNNYDCTPLYLAVKNKHIEMINLLLLQPDVQIYSENLNNPFVLAIINKSYEIIKLLIPELNTIDINTSKKDENIMNILLIWAVKHKNKKIVQLLLKQPGIDVNINDNNGYTPLHLAVDEKNMKMIRLLLSQPGINMNAKDNNGDTPLHLAVVNGRMDIIRELLKLPDIDINAKDNNGDTPLHWAVVKEYTDIVQELLKLPDIEINAKDNNGYTPLHWAAVNGYMDIVQELLKLPDIDINAKNNNGDTPLYKAYEYKRTEIIKELLRQPDINIESEIGF
ncbi:ankyrin repeat domain-containing protein, partial [uncultured Brachyspira sp.]|uniref:ankyrin repeat domain-containing protein n=1 Tax=uncultured Brachyspira sp. TaxID=221953 RepID=UPI0026370467